MKRKLLAVILLCGAVFGAGAQNISEGRRTFWEWGTDYRSEGSADLLNSVVNTGVSYSTGYQLNRNLFLGGGAELSFGLTLPQVTLPIYMQVRTDQNWGGFTPFADLRLGYSLTNASEESGLYVSPMVGYRFAIGKGNHGISVGLGMTMKGRMKYHESVYDPETGTHHVWSVKPNFFKQSFRNAFAIRLSWDY